MQNWSSRRVGGVETYASLMLAGLHTRGHELAFWAECDEPADRPPIPVPASTPTWTASDVTELRAWKPDVLLANGYLDPRLEEAALEVAPAILVAHSYYGSCISGTKCTAFPQPRPCDRRFGPGCLVNYLPRRCGGLNPLTMWRMYRAQRARQALLGRYRAVVVLSEHMREEFLRHDLQPERVVLIPPAVAEPIATAADTVQWPPAEYRLVMASRCDHIKGGAVLLEALPEITRRLGRPVLLEILGDGPERPRWERTSRELQRRHSGLRVSFAGWVSPAEVETVYRRSHLLVVPSLLPEPFGLVGLEAARHAVPAAAFDAGGIRDWLHDGVNGRLAPADPPTARGLADAISECLADGERYRQMCAAARATAERFSTADPAAALETVLATAARTK